MTNLRDILRDMLIEYTSERNEIEDANYETEIEELRNRKIDETVERVKTQLIGE